MLLKTLELTFSPCFHTREVKKITPFGRAGHLETENHLSKTYTQEENTAGELQDRASKTQELYVP